MTVKDFTGDNFFGCEFIKPSIHFTDRLNGKKINHVSKVIQHLQSNNHKKDYESYRSRHVDYERKQKQSNIDLAEALLAEEDKNVVLFETKNGSSAFIDSCESQ